MSTFARRAAPVGGLTGRIAMDLPRCSYHYPRWPGDWMGDAKASGAQCDAPATRCDTVGVRHYCAAHYHVPASIRLPEDGYARAPKWRIPEMDG